MTLSDRIRHAWRDLFPVLGKRPAAVNGGLAPPAECAGLAPAPSPPDHLTWSERFEILGELLRDWFYSVALLLSIAVPVLAVTVIINLRASMIAWHSQQIMNDRESRCLTVQRRAGDTSADSLDDVVREPEPLAGVFGETQLNYFKTTFATAYHLAPLLGVYGYCEHPLTIDRLNGLQPGAPGSNYMRSVETHSPALDAVNFLWRETPVDESPFHGDGSGQVAIHQLVADRIGLKYPPPPGEHLEAEIVNTPTLFIEPCTSIGYDPAQPVRVVGVFAEAHPDPNGGTPHILAFVSHYFINEMKLGRWYPVPLYMSALWGPLPKGVDTVDLPHKLVTALEDIGVRVDSPTPVEYQGGHWISLVRESDRQLREHGPLKEITWNLAVAKAIDRASAASEIWDRGLGRALWGPLSGNAPPAPVEKIQLALDPEHLQLAPTKPAEMDDDRWLSVVKKSGAETAPGWTEVQRILGGQSSLAGPGVRVAPRLLCLSPADLRAPPSPLQFDRLDLEVNTLHELVDLAQVVSGDLKLLLVNEERVKSARRAIQADDGFHQFQNLVEIVTGLLAVIAVALAISQRIHQKTSEIGIMRAFGAPFGVILSILLLQIVTLWAGAVLLNLVFAPWVSAPLCHTFQKIAESNQLAENPGSVIQTAGPATFWQMWDGHYFQYLPLAQMAGWALLLAAAVTTIAGVFAARTSPARALKLR